MQGEFLTTFKRKSHRERFYSSMNYDQYCDVYGPPSPPFKPQEDPVDDIPLLELQTPLPQSACDGEEDQNFMTARKMDTIFEIEGSENYTQNFQKSPYNDFPFSSTKSRVTMATSGQIEPPRRPRIRMRSQSDNSEYLIFNFLQRNNQKGRKKVKLE